MTQPSPTPEASERLTSRQRRIEEQRRKIDSVRKEQRRKRMLWGAVGVAAAVVVIALVMLLVKPPVAAQGHQVPIEGNRNHVPQAQPIAYRNRPPSSGDHYEQPAGYGASEREIPSGNWVHSLEHGGIVVLYKPEQCDQACVAQLREVYGSAPMSALFPGIRKMVVTPYTDMDHPITAVAWGWVDELDQTAPVDKDRILAFYRAHVDKGPETAQ